SRNAVLIGALAGLMPATPVLAAAEDACLRHNRILTWRAVDDRTVMVTDRSRNRYTVHMSPGCLGLNDGTAALVFRPTLELGCIGPGDILGVQTAAHGFISCSIRSVQTG
ncbi:MAG: hypothetical protein ACREVH_03760, partial [Gammaproteobacteria bacterium]